MAIVEDYYTCYAEVSINKNATIIKKQEYPDLPVDPMFLL